MKKRSRPGRRSWLDKLFSSRKPPARPARKSALRLEPLEPRWMMHSGEVQTPRHAVGDHIHPVLSIFVDGEKVAIPANIGISTTSAANPHTHDAAGILHVGEGGPAGTSTETRYVTLDDFFDVWRTSAGTVGNNPNATFDRTHLMGKTVDATHSLYMFVNGEPNHLYEEYIPEDGDQVVLVYSANPVVTLNTNYGPIVVELFQNAPQDPALKIGTGATRATPITVNNFLNYVNDTTTNGGDYQNAFFHRSIAGFVLQGGGFRSATTAFDGTDGFTSITTDAQITNEPGNNNIRGTIAMAKLGGNPNSATNQWFVNLADNGSNLNAQNGGFTVFGRVLDMTTVDKIAALESVRIFNGVLSGNQEVPTVTTSATGTVELVQHRGNGDTDTSNDNQKFDIEIFVQGITKANLTAAHIHLGAVGQEGASIFDLGDGSQWTEVTGGLRRVITEATFPAANLSSLLNGQTYVNIHTTANPDGELRAQLNADGLYSDLPLGTNRLVPQITSVEGDGVVRGRVFEDKDFDNQFDTNESGLSAVVVYSDANNNGTLDSGETSTVTASDGQYALRLPDGTHTIRQVLPTGFTQSSPSNPTSFTVDVQIGREIANRNFADLNAPDGDLIRIRTEITTLAGQPLTTIDAGQEFNVNVYVDDLRTGTGAQGVFSAYVDVSFDNHKVQFVGPITYGEGFSTAKTGTGNGNQGVEEVGAIFFTTDPPGGAERKLFSFKAKAIAGGTETISLNPGEAQGSEINMFGVNNSLPASLIDFRSASLAISSTVGANDDIYNFDEDSTNNSLTVLDNDLGQTPAIQFTITATSTPNRGGTVTRAADNKSLIYTPAANFFGEETFTYTVTDGSNNTDTASVTVQVQPKNDPPTAANDSFNFAEDPGQQSLFVLANDSFTPDAGETLKVSALGATSAGGVISIGPGQTHILYTPAANYFGQETFTYDVSDGNGGTAKGTVTVTLTSVNDAPDAVDDQFPVQEDSSANIMAVLANDTTEAGETLTVTLVDLVGARGAAVIAADKRSINYTPPANFFGTDVFKYTITDGTLTDTATVTVTVANVNDPPSATNDSVTIAKNSTANTLNPLTNDSSGPSETDSLTITATSTPAHGTVTISADKKTVNYVPTVGYEGADSFTYTISDGGATTSTATANVNVVPFIPSKINGFVYADADNDGTRDTGETGIAGVSLTLTGTDNFGGAQSFTATTAADGSYEFANLPPGTYTVKETQPTGFVDGAESAGSLGGVTTTNDQISGIVLPENTTATNYNFGELKPASFEGFVYIDANNNGVKDSGEEAIPNVKVTIASSPAGFTREAMTDSTGKYRFTDLPPGAYIVTESQPADFVDGKDTIGTGMQEGSAGADSFTFRLAQNAAATGSNFGELKKTTIAGGLGVGNTGSNGSSMRFLSTALTLFAASNNDSPGAQVATVKTAADGTFLFDSIAPGRYVVQPPPFFVSSTPLVIDTTNGQQTANNQFGNLERAPQFAGLGDFTARAPKDYLMAAVDASKTGDAQTLAVIPGGGWDGTTNAVVRLTGNPYAAGTSVEITLTDSAGARTRATVPVSDLKHVRFLSRDGDKYLIRINGPKSEFTFTPVTTGSGEPGSTAPAAVSLSVPPAAAAPVSAPVPVTPPILVSPPAFTPVVSRTATPASVMSTTFVAPPVAPVVSPPIVTTVSQPVSAALSAPAPVVSAAPNGDSFFVPELESTTPDASGDESPAGSDVDSGPTMTFVSAPTWSDVSEVGESDDLIDLFGADHAEYVDAVDALFGADDWA